jgi:hypothetical protein
MPDILGQGDERRPGPWPRRLAALAALLLLAGVIVVHLPRHAHATHAAVPRRPPATLSPATLPATPMPATGVAAVPDGVTGPTLPWDGNVRLPVAGPRPAWFWPSTGRTQAIGGLPPDDSGYQFIGVAGGWAVQAGPAPEPRCSGCAGPPRPVYFLGDQARSVTRVGVADAVAPGAVPGTVWLTSYPPDAEQGTASGTAQELSVAGKPLGPQVTLPPGDAIEQATDRGLLLVPAVQRSGPPVYTLWDATGSRPSRTFSGVIAASANAIAWAPPCDPVCRVQVLDLATGRRTIVTLPGSAANAAFSPDGDLLAVELSFYNGGDDGALATQLAVASVASGRLTVVPGTWASSDALVGFGWLADGDSLIAELSFTTKVQVTSWRPGQAGLAVAAVRPGQDSDSLVLG